MTTSDPNKEINKCEHPTSITDYIEEVLRTPNTSQVDLMRHEWARYQTYRTFPKTSKVQSIRLSQTGFYSTGRDDETTCYSCRLRYRNWKPEDSPKKIHEQMSPNCPFLNGYDNRNVAIERDHKITGRHQHSERRYHINNNEILQIESGISENRSESFPARNFQPASPGKNKEITMTGTREVDTNEGTSCNIESSLELRERRTPDITNDRAKHSYYAVLSNRLASFTSCAGITNLQSNELASAGFYYVGTGDCVRCYYCGGGLRNWQNGDDPYVEHARWYPHCDFIRVSRGDDFVRKQARDASHSTEANFDEASSNVNTLCTAQENLEKNELMTAAAQSIISMGYNVQTVTKAIETFRVQQATDFTAEQLLELILDTQEEQSNVINGSFRNKRVSDPRSREAGVSSTTDINLSSIEKEPCNARFDRQQSSNATSSVNDLESILQENRDLKEQMTCKICMDAEACIVFLPCSHMMTCIQCAPAFRKCPVCRAIVRATVQAFL